jgi:ribosomal protein L24
MAKSSLFKVGDRVRVKKGPLYGKTGTIRLVRDDVVCLIWLDVVIGCVDNGAAKEDELERM